MNISEVELRHGIFTFARRTLNQWATGEPPNPVFKAEAELFWGRWRWEAKLRSSLFPCTCSAGHLLGTQDGEAQCSSPLPW